MGRSQIDVAGGPASTIGGELQLRGGDWNRDGILITGNPRGIARLSVADGKSSLVTTADPKIDLDHIHPFFLPDSRRFLYVHNGLDRRSASVYWGSIDNAPERQPSTPLIPSIQAGTADIPVLYVPAAKDPNTGHVLFKRDNTVVAQPFNADSLKLMGEPAPVSERNVAVFTATSGA